MQLRQWSRRASRTFGAVAHTVSCNNDLDNNNVAGTAPETSVHENATVAVACATKPYAMRNVRAHNRTPQPRPAIVDDSDDCHNVRMFAMLAMMGSVAVVARRAVA